MVNVCVFKNFPAFAEHVYSTESEFYRRENLPFPCINLGEDGDAIHVRALMPGVSRTNLRLTLSERTLIIDGELPPLPGRYYRQERFSGPFRRVAILSAPVRHDAVTARLRDGVLDMTLPKLPRDAFRPLASRIGRKTAQEIGQEEDRVPRSCGPLHRRRIRPATDIVERPDGILLLINLPGVNPENLSVEADHRYLCVRSLPSRGGPDGGSGLSPAGGSVLALEFVNREYEIRVALSSAQDIEHIAARLKDGVLSVLLPRRRVAGPRMIPVITDED